MKHKISKIEKTIYSLAVVMLLMVPFVSIFGQATTSKINVEVERLRKEIVIEEDDIECLNMKINELVSFDNITEVANEMGLTYNNKNIVSVK